MNKLINFQFKGNRTYVQGGDIYNHVSGLLGNDEYVNDISIRQVTSKNCYLKTAADKTDIVVCIVKTNERNYVLVEGTTSANGSYAFDEEYLLKDATVNGNIVTMEVQDKFSLIENIIALTKKLNYSVNPEVNGKWLFGQLKLDKPFPAKPHNIKIENTRRIPNRFSENSITIDGINYGTIIFIVGKP
jgi:hypothetical protein